MDKPLTAFTPFVKQAIIGSFSERPLFPLFLSRPFGTAEIARKTGCWSKTMQQPQVTTYADIAEVRAVTGAAVCNQLLAEGWVLLGVYQ
jgi:hypothetical protein